MAINKTAKNMYIKVKGTHSIVAGTYTETAGKITITATEGNLTLISNKKNIINGKEGAVYGDYTAQPEKTQQETKHPKIEEVQFLDENDKLICQEKLTQFEDITASNILYGKKIKIKIITKEVEDGTKISFNLIGETKSINQDFLGLDKLSWNLEVNGNICETELFTINPLWYSEDFENYNYDSYKTKIKSENLNLFYVKGILNAIPFELPEKEDRLAPKAYLRNYEELIGLFNTEKPKADNLTNKNLLNNYENKFIKLNSEMLEIEREFSDFINNTKELTIEQIKTRVEQDAKCIWDASIKQVQSGNLDDRPLYWTRNKMQVRLKRHFLFEKDIDFKKSQVKPNSELEKIIQLFEEKSRNYNGIDFSKTPVGKKKLLITGFDPFIMNPDPNMTNKNDIGNPLQSNPSGVNALFLHGKTIGNYLIQTLICPVRYGDFDNFKKGKGIIEIFVQPFINEVDIIITVSQGGVFRFDVDRFPCKNRGGYMDNMFWGKSQNGYNEEKFKQLTDGKEFYETTLPFEKIVPTKNNPTDDFWTYFNQTFVAVGDQDTEDNNESCLLDRQLSEIQFLKSIEGSGSNYLSNEIFYRVAKMRTEQNPTLKTGHLHIPLIQSKNNYTVRNNKTTVDMNPKIKELIEQIQKIISKI